jgi:hypothetical protein
MTKKREEILRTLDRKRRKILTWFDITNVFLVNIFSNNDFVFNVSEFILEDLIGDIYRIKGTWYGYKLKDL